MIFKHNFNNILKKLPFINIGVIGDLILDYYIFGDTNRISPEAPVPVINVLNEKYLAGGAANVSLNIKSLGSKTWIKGVIGKDIYGNKLKKFLYQNKIFNYSNYIDYTTIIKTRILVRNQQLCRIDKEYSKNIYKLKYSQEFYNQLKETNAIIISDYNKGTINSECLQKLINSCRKNNIWISIDPKPRSNLHFIGANLMTPNKTEALKLADIELSSDNDIYPYEKVVFNIYKKFKHDYLVITLGADGMLICKKDKIIKKIPTYAKEVYDVSGAGDTVIASLTIALISGLSIEEASHFANFAAGIVVSKVGTATISMKSLINSYKMKNLL